MINIVHFSTNPDASNTLRIHQPQKMLSTIRDFEFHSMDKVLMEYSKDGNFNLQNPVFEDADILWLFITDIHKKNYEFMSKIVEYFISKKKIIVCDTDDNYFNIPDSNFHKATLSNDIPIFKQILETAHVVTVTGKHLRWEMKRYNTNVVVLPNMIDAGKYPLRKSGNEKIRIGWSGGLTHSDDLSIVMPSLQTISREFPVELVLFGLFEENIEGIIRQIETLTRRPGDETLERRFTHNPCLYDFVKMARQFGNIPYRHIPVVNYRDFPHRLSQANFDIGICPLRDNIFNRCRSAVKFAQYAAVGTVTVASRVYPYTSECNYLADNTTKDWTEKLTKLILDEAFRHSILEDQRRYIMANRNIQSGFKLYENFFRAIAGHRNPG